METQQLILISAGGTGGHIFPAEALARDLSGRGYRVAVATDARGQKYGHFPEDTAIHSLASAPMRSGFLSKLKSGALLMVGCLQAGKLVDRLKPSVVVGFGGYPSFPAVYAAQKKDIPTIIHEQNAILGKANALLAPKADRIALSWNSVEAISESDAVRSVITGNPVRPEIAALYNQPYPEIKQDGPLKVLVLGGSQGASIFSQVLPEVIKELSQEQRARIQITQQCRQEDIEEVEAAYKEMGVQAELATFFDDVAQRLTNCHLVIARSGAGTVAEVTTAGRPAIFVPYPHHKDQQQKRNADTVFDAGGAWVMTQDGFTVEALSARLETFLQNPEALFRAAENARTCGVPDAARKLGNLVTALASGWDKDAHKTFDLTQGHK
ncbi:MAG: undecaprenyldiphospho-muramoylpentapeptide beta-N-acetylglucosaminyltransferase [Alphaproteobacteria bacterium]|nr:undecaprenyldiphospho-muramoylpentapeptide beta-N-acetylglucosaminyltransferase [Alphaproteobacteria bacterium]